jgi:hypothetical protein
VPLDPLAGLELNSNTSLALDRAVAERRGRPVNTSGLLRAVVSVDSVGDWAWVQGAGGPRSVDAFQGVADGD